MTGKQIMAARMDTKPYSDTDLKDFLHERVLARSAAANERFLRAYRSDINGRVRTRTGYDRHLAARIQGYLRRIYPEAIELPNRLTEHPSYMSTLYQLLQRGRIEFPWGGSINKNLRGELNGTNIGRVALTAKGYDALRSARINAIRLAVAIVTAVSVGISAALALIQSTSSP